MLRYALASQFWRAIPAWWADRAWRRRGQRLLVQAAASVPAYRQLLDVFQPSGGAGVFAGPPFDKPASVTQPLETSRRSYVEVFGPDLRGRTGWQRQIVSFDPLSPQGAGGDCWPRSADELRIRREQLVDLLSSWFEAHRRRTLLLARLPVAGWCSGRRVLPAIQEAIGLGQLNALLDDWATQTGQVQETVRRLAGQVEQCVLLCQPQEAVPAVRQLAGKVGRIGVVVFGALSTRQRAEMPEGTRVCSVWGAEEVGPLIGLETPLTRMVARACQADPRLREAMALGRGAVIGLYQPFPLGPWIEQDANEILVSSWGALPVIRYRLEQRGRLVDFATVCELLLQHEVQSIRQIRRLTRMGSACWKLPVLLLCGS